MRFPLIKRTMVALLLTAWSAIIAIARPYSPAQGKESVRQKIEKICAQEPLASGAVGVLAVTLSGDTLACVNPNVRLVPASNIKLLTTGLALKELGSDYRFRTEIGYSGKIENGVLNGDLYILGGGDPTTAARVDCADPIDYLLRQWCKMIKDAGIKAVNGRVIGDSRYFDQSVFESLHWGFEDLGAYYGALPSGLNFFENSQYFLVKPGPSVGTSPSFTIQYPQTPWMNYSSLALTQKALSANTLYYVNSSLSPQGRFGGSFPIDRKAYTLRCSNYFAPLTCAYYFWNSLSDAGIKASKGYADVDAFGKIRSSENLEASFVGSTLAAPREELTVLGATYSTRLGEIIRHANFESDNFFAQTLFYMMGKTRYGSSDVDACIKAVLDGLKSMGLDLNFCELVDGNGLSRKNYVSPGFLVDFLKVMASEKEFDIFLRSLPSPGDIGTLEFKFREKSAEFRRSIKMKSGSLGGVRCYSGYILSPSDDPSQTIVFSILTNNVTASSSKAYAAIDSIIELIAE